MSLITILENNALKEYKENYYLNLMLEKYLVESYFDWLKIEVSGKLLQGKGKLVVGKNTYPIELYYSPFFDGYRFDRIYIKDKSIKYNHKIHLYKDLSLCLYHPIVDKPFLKPIPLYKMVPWISEWCIFYEKWKKYGVWLGKEIKHNFSDGGFKQ